jgi:ectoine hydroxylase-related dioxygenase (phytanoyl-CoA dioxygenase family)
MSPLASELLEACPLPRFHEHVSVAALEHALKTAGCAIIEGAIDARLLQRIHGELDPWFATAPCGAGHFFGRRTKRFSGLFAKAPSTAALALHQAVLPAIEAVLLGPHEAPSADCLQLNLTQAIEIGPGEPAQLLHRDDGLFPAPKTLELMADVMWTLDDFTLDNGATRLLPGSHLWPRREIEQYEAGLVSAVAPAGSAIVWLGSLLHGGGENHSKRARRGVVMSYSLGWLAPAEKLLLSTPPESARLLPEKLQRLIGYQVHRPNLGWIEGRDPLEWLNGEFIDLAPAHDNLTPAQEDMMHQYLRAVGRIS